MTEVFWVRNLLAYTVQIAALVAAGALLSWVFRLQEPRVTLVYWRGILAACLLLPAMQPWAHDVIANPPVERVIGETVTASVPGRDPGPAPMAFGEAMLAVLAAGCLARVAWTGLGLVRLHQYRRRARPMEEPPVLVPELRCALAPEASIAISEDIRGPVTFGLFKPVVLLPESFLRQSERVQRAVLCHELLHVARRDAVYALAEEAVAALFWFHPAVWWLIARIRLACEQAVDRQAIELIADRKQYLDAVLETAGVQVAAPGAGFASPLLRKSQLVERVALIVQEIRMSKARLFASTAASAVLVLAAAVLAVRAFPLKGEPQEAGQQAPSSNRARVGANVQAKMLVSAPACVSSENAGANISLQVVIGTDGSVIEAAVAPDVPQIVRAAADCVKTWKYQPLVVDGKSKEVVTTVTVHLVGADGKPPTVSIDATPRPQDLKSGRAGGVVGGVPGGMVGVVSGDAVGGVPGGVVGGVPGGIQGGAPGSEPEPFPAAEAGQMRIRVGESVAKAKLAYGPEPVYPPLALLARLQGIVRFRVLIAANGQMKSFTLLSGHPLLVQPAKDVLGQYRYETTLLNGNPVEVVTDVEIPFRLP